MLKCADNLLVGRDANQGEDNGWYPEEDERGDYTTKCE